MLAGLGHRALLARQARCLHEAERLVPAVPDRILVLVRPLVDLLAVLGDVDRAHDADALAERHLAALRARSLAVDLDQALARLDRPREHRRRHVLLAAPLAACSGSRRKPGTAAGAGSCTASARPRGHAPSRPRRPRPAHRRGSSSTGSAASSGCPRRTGTAPRRSALCS